jgi:hypothetical protein
MKVVMEFSVEKVYLFVIFFLMVLQVYQYYIYQKAKSEISKLWTAITTVSLGVAMEITKIQQDVTKQKDDEKK